MAIASSGAMPVASEDSTATPSPETGGASVRAPEVYRYNGKAYASLGEVNEAIFADTGVRPVSSVAEVEARATAAVTPAEAANVLPARATNGAPAMAANANVPPADVMPVMAANSHDTADNAAPAVASDVPPSGNAEPYVPTAKDGVN